MRVLVACECSQEVMSAFRLLGDDSFSCDLQAARGSFPEYHLQCDVKDVLKYDWDLIIAHPPCTYLSNAGACRLYSGGVLNQDRYQHGLASRDFFMMFYNHSCKHICIENPIPSKIYELPKPDQVIEPYMFGHGYSKKTYLWLKGLPFLMLTDWVYPFKPYVDSSTQKGYSRAGGSSYVRSKTFSGIANAMAIQWHDFITAAY